MGTYVIFATLGFIYTTFTINQGSVALFQCGEVTSRFSTVPLNCSSHQMIHVISKRYGKKDSTTSCPETSHSCSNVFGTDSLFAHCNGQERCFEVTAISGKCTNIWAIKIEYECVKGSIDICSPVNKLMNGSVYLHTPGFPYSKGSNNSCHCEITGSLMRVTVLELEPGQGVIISTDNSTTWYNSKFHYNKLIASRTGSVVLDYMHNNDNTSSAKVWIQIEDNGSMKVSCWQENESLTTADKGPTPSPSPETHHQTITSKSTTTDNNLPIPVIAGSGAAGAILLAAIVAVTVLLRRRLNKSNDRNTLHRTTGNCKPNNALEGRIYFELDSNFVNGKDCTESSTNAAFSASSGSKVSPQTDMNEEIRYTSHPLSKEPGEASKPKRMMQGKNVDDRSEGMVVNDLYHSFKPEPAPGSSVEGQESCRSVEGNLQAHMDDNDLYHHIVRSKKVCVREKPTVGNYEEINDDDLCASQEADHSVRKQRPAVYDDLKLHTQKDWVREEHAVGNYEEIMDETLCVSQEAKSSIHMQRPSAYNELKLHTQKEWASEKPTVDNYDQIKDEDLCVSPEGKRSILMQRNSAYDELKLHTHKDWVREKPVVGNCDKIKKGDLCVSTEGKRSVLMQKP